MRDEMTMRANETRVKLVIELLKNTSSPYAMRIIVRFLKICKCKKGEREQSGGTGRR